MAPTGAQQAKLVEKLRPAAWHQELPADVAVFDDGVLASLPEDLQGEVRVV